MKMFVSSVLPDLEETMKRVLPRVMAHSIAVICAGSVLSNMWKRGPAGLAPERLAQHFRTQARAAHAEQNNIREAALFHVLREALQ